MKITDENILCISAIDWDFIWQGNQEIMSTLAAQGSTVLFIDNTGVRRPSWQDIPRLRQRIKNWRAGVKGVRKERENLFVYSPLILPFPYSRLARALNRLLVLRVIKRWMRSFEFYNPIVWTFLPTGLAIDIIRGVDPKLVIYYCIDNFEASSTGARRVRKTEGQLLQKADLVFVTSQRLKDRCLRLNPRVHLFPFAVNIEAIQGAANGNPGPPPDLVGVPRPIVGYVGGIHKWLDQELVHRIATVHPDYSFVFVGPLQTEVDTLKSLTNLHFLGPKNHSDLGHYIQAFDAALIPYRLTEYTEHVYPTKLNEYLALGKPVISTDLPEVRAFGDRNPGVVEVAQTPDDFARCVETALRSNSAEQARRREEVALRHTWASHLHEMNQLIGKGLLAKREKVKSTWDRLLLGTFTRGRRRLAYFGGGSLIVYYLIFLSPLPWWLSAPLKIAQPPKRADVISVFGGGVGETGRPGANTIERAQYAAELYLAGYAPHIIFSSGYTYRTNDAENMKLVAVSLGVPAKAVILEQKANSAQQNVRYVAAILREKGWDSVLVVSSPYNMRRLSLVFNKWGKGLDVTYTPVPHPRFYDRSKGKRTEQLRAFLHEYMGILYYWLRGYIDS